jgi:hypothetical protein
MDAEPYPLTNRIKACPLSWRLTDESFPAHRGRDPAPILDEAFDPWMDEWMDEWKRKK